MHEATVSEFICLLVLLHLEGRICLVSSITTSSYILPASSAYTCNVYVKIQSMNLRESLGMVHEKVWRKEREREMM